MYLNARNAALYTVLFAAALVTWLASRPDPEVQIAPGPSADNPPGYYLKDVVLHGTDEAGTVLYRIVAGQVEESGAERRLELRDVRIQYRESEDVAWLIEAERAVAPSDRSYLDLQGNTRMTSSGEQPSGQIVIESNQLRFEPERFSASTDSPVSLAFGGRRLEAVGLAADLKGDRLELRSSVRGRFVP